MKPRWKRCVETEDALLGEAFGQRYVERHFPPEAKARMQELVKNILLGMDDTIRWLDWMGTDIKRQALAKLATFNPKVGYPDNWIDYSSVEITPTSHYENVVAGAKFATADDRSQIGKPLDRGRWRMTPPTSKAYYNPLNEIVFPAGIFQPPGFDGRSEDRLARIPEGAADQPRAGDRQVDAEQQFLIAWGQFRGDAIRPEAQRLMVQRGPHPTCQYRVIGPLCRTCPSSRRRSAASRTR